MNNSQVYSNGKRHERVDLPRKQPSDLSDHLPPLLIHKLRELYSDKGAKLVRELLTGQVSDEVIEALIEELESTATPPSDEPPETPAPEQANIPPPEPAPPPANTVKPPTPTLSPEIVHYWSDRTIDVMTTHPDHLKVWVHELESSLHFDPIHEDWEMAVAFLYGLLLILEGRPVSLLRDNPYAFAVDRVNTAIADWTAALQTPPVEMPPESTDISHAAEGEPDRADAPGIYELETFPPEDDDESAFYEAETVRTAAINDEPDIYELETFAPEDDADDFALYEAETVRIEAIDDVSAVHELETIAIEDESESATYETDSVQIPVTAPVNHEALPTLAEIYAERGEDAVRTMLQGLMPPRYIERILSRLEQANGDDPVGN